jgi:hypothetical protein
MPVPVRRLQAVSPVRMSMAVKYQASSVVLSADGSFGFV